MSDDLLSLRMLVVSDTASHRDVWRQGAALASVPIDFTEAISLSSAENAFRSPPPDILFVDTALTGADDLIRAAREMEQAPFVVAFTHKAARGKPEGADGHVAHATDADQARDTINRCIKARMPARTLIVDDSSTMRAIVRKILEASRFKLTISDAAESEAALTAIRQGSVDFAFVDCNMPGRSGLDILAEAKQQAPHTAVIMISAVLDPAVADHARRAGATAFLKKPFFPKDVDAVLEGHYRLNGPV